MKLFTIIILSLFKLCSITPILKTDSSSIAENYYPIANIPKLNESLVLQSIKPHVKKMLS